MKTRMIQSGVLLVGLLLAATSARADYISQTFDLKAGGMNTSDLVLLETYDGVGAAGGGLAAGQARITYSPLAMDAANPNVLSGFQAMGFNSSVNIDASQIQVPTGWNLYKDMKLDAYGRFSWGAATTKDWLETSQFLISGLGADAKPSTFVVGSTTKGVTPPANSVYFAAHHLSLSFDENGVKLQSTWVATDPVTATPEPTTLALAGIGIIGLFCGRLLRRIRKF